MYHVWEDVDQGPLFASLVFCAVVAALCFFLQEVTGNCSQVDKLWSILPGINAWIFYFYDTSNMRLLIMALCVTVWAVRLTYNFNRRGGYTWPPWSGEEDYRWPVLRTIITNKILWKLFGFFFIAAYQNLLLTLLTVPCAVAYHYDNREVVWVDFVVSFFFLLLVLIETIADQQQYNFQTEKYRIIREKETLHGDYEKGFITRGLFAYCRHPNYAAEQALWLVFYFFSQVAQQSWAPNESILGAVLLILLFQASARFSEGLTAKKYPAYLEYQRHVWMFLPWFPSRHTDVAPSDSSK